jgi:hypothetical protein
MEQQIDYQMLAGAMLKNIGGLAPQQERLMIGPNGTLVKPSEWYSAQKAVSGTPTASYGHGQFGLFSSPALERQVFSALMLPRMGLLSRLPARPSNFSSPLYGIITGVTATTGAEPNGVCDDFPVAGLMKLCMQSAYFGRQGRMTPVFDIDRIGMLNNRGEHTDFQLLPGNAPVGMGSAGAWSPTIPGQNNPMILEIAKAMFELGTAWSRDFAYEVYTGNPTNNSAGGGRKYYRGLDLLINTGFQDAETGVACPAADSLVESFGNLDVASNGQALLRRVTSIYRRLKFIDMMTGLAPVKRIITMPWSMFYEITEIWPIAYMTYRNTISLSNQYLFNQGKDVNDLRDRMRGNQDTLTGQFLLIDGEEVEVVIDQGISESEIAGQSFRSPMYFIPLTVLGGVEVTYIEYVDYDRGGAPGGAVEAGNFFTAPGTYFSSDGGRFLWHKKPPTNFCVQMLAKTETRIILRTPFLAARLTGVQYTPIAHERGWDPNLGSANNSFYTNGGSTTRTAQTTKDSFYLPTA